MSISTGYTVLLLAWMGLFFPAYLISRRSPLAAVGFTATIWATLGVFLYVGGDYRLDEAVVVGFIGAGWAAIGVALGYFRGARPNSRTSNT